MVGGLCRRAASGYSHLGEGSCLYFNSHIWRVRRLCHCSDLYPGKALPHSWVQSIGVLDMAVFTSTLYIHIELHPLHTHSLGAFFAPYTVTSNLWYIFILGFSNAVQKLAQGPSNACLYMLHCNVLTFSFKTTFKKNHTCMSSDKETPHKPEFAHSLYE